MASHPYMALLSRESPRYAAWLKVFRDDKVPIRSPVSFPAGTPIGVREVYLVELDALDDATRARLWQHLAERTGDTPEVVRDTIAAEGGLPIVADDVLVSIDLRYV